MPVDVTLEGAAAAAIYWRAVERCNVAGTCSEHYYRQAIIEEIAALIAEGEAAKAALWHAQQLALQQAVELGEMKVQRDAARAAHGRLREAAEEYLVHEIREPSGADICELCEVVAVSDDWAQPFPHAPDCPLAPLEEPK